MTKIEKEISKLKAYLETVRKNKILTDDLKKHTVLKLENKIKSLEDEQEKDVQEEHEEKQSKAKKISIGKRKYTTVKSENPARKASGKYSGWIHKLKKDRKVKVEKHYRLPHGYEVIKGSDKNRNYGFDDVKLPRGYRMPHGYTTKMGLKDKKYEEGGHIPENSLYVDNYLGKKWNELTEEQKEHFSSYLSFLYDSK